VSGAADRPGAPLPPAWERLEHGADEAIAALEAWRARAEQAEAEVTRLRGALENAIRDIAADVPDPREARDQLRRLRAENAALRSRIAQANRRLRVMLDWTDALEPEP
jgi:phosphoglycolate phosphatase-like HAD superfamily hydrolase